jgi:hypothetical protein
VTMDVYNEALSLVNTTEAKLWEIEECSLSAMLDNVRVAPHINKLKIIDNILVFFFVSGCRRHRSSIYCVYTSHC